jgi:hypothetical protein
MPDNVSRGMLETLLLFCAEGANDPLLKFATKCADESRAAHGAPWREMHRDKALIHTFLAWQDPPGNPFGTAITARMLDPTTERARAFVDWVVTLFGLEALRITPT